ncbi:DUF3073 domain-containing protein [Glutamicibacter sp. PS]|uniref:DUF3073 domain-containing protein n=1 Tax=Glutamicibacter TaxID=1742989 RepID=UPI00284761D4|nr:DUF3073 domain-containing protein [Glutamicibacter sp. PS]MDR4532041.1 DUF3073 domain-containing protein [Glutamicibacter sp. PS]
MGRGRQKAKAQRQARDIKYYSPATDLSALERELGVRPDPHAQGVEPAETSYDDEEYSDYDELAKKYSSDPEED